MSRVAIYARVSTKEQTTEAQVAQLTAYCQSRGWTDVAVFRDDGISGVRDNRPELDRLRQQMMMGEFNAVAVSRMDRLGRSLGMILRFWDDADAAGARVIVIDQGIDISTPAGRLQRNMLAALAEFERELILERTQAGVARARALGKKFGAPRRISESIAREVRERRARGESLRVISADEHQAWRGSFGPETGLYSLCEDPACASGCHRSLTGLIPFEPESKPRDEEGGPNSGRRKVTLSITS